MPINIEMTNQLFFSINKHYFHTNIDLDLKNIESRYQILREFHPYVDYQCIVTKSKYRKTFANKLHHYVVDDSIDWPYHLFFLFNHPTEEMLSIIPSKIKRNRHFKKLYNREFKKPQLITNSTFIELNEINNLQEIVLEARNYVKPRHLW